MPYFPSLIRLSYTAPPKAPEGEDNSDQYPQSLPKYFLEKLGLPEGAKVLDPFMGLGTSAFVAEEMGYVPYGIENDRFRCEWTAGQLENWQNVVCSDAIDIHSFNWPKMDVCITSPPFMRQSDRWNPLGDGEEEGGAYEVYLSQLASIFRQIRRVLKQDAYVFVHVDNLSGKVFTPLVRDFSYTISEHFTAIGETIIVWDDPPEGWSHTHMLIFKV